MTGRASQPKAMPAEKSQPEADLVLTPALAFIRALARHEAWLDLNKRLKRYDNCDLIDPNLLTPID
jgi:hypothetical protein